MKYKKRFLSLITTFICMVPVISGGWNYHLNSLKVACVGDSITYGARLEHPEKDSYPAQLQLMLGKKYEVTNFGVGGCTLIRKGKPTVWSQIPAIFETKPHLVVISLGTNDTCGKGTCGNRKCWEYQREFKKDYQDLIDTLSAISTKPRIFICAPSPMVLETPGLSSERLTGLTIRKPRLQKLINYIKKVAKKKKVEYIDLNTPLDYRPELFTETDGVHPNQAGYRAIAELVYSQLVE